jgi:hypothetical protein
MVTILFVNVETDLEELTLDAAVSETHSGDAEVTEHPVERGANVVDHVRVKQDVLKIEGIITDTPIGAFGDAGRSQSAYETLLGIKNAGAPVYVSTPLREYSEMVMASLEVPRDAKTGAGVRFSASFRKIVTAETLTAKVAVPNAKKDLGKKPTAAATPAVEAKAKSGFLLLNGVINKAIGLDP